MTDKENLQEKATKKSKKRVDFLQYSGMAMQMGATIGLFVFIGFKLDAWLQTKAVFTVIFSLVGVGMTLYSFIKRVG